MTLHSNKRKKNNLFPKKKPMTTVQDKKFFFFHIFLVWPNMANWMSFEELRMVEASRQDKGNLLALASTPIHVPQSHEYHIENQLKPRPETYHVDMFCGPVPNELVCPCCLEVPAKSVLNLEVCGHVVCTPCLKKWRNQHASCPVCRAAVVKLPQQMAPNPFVSRMIENLVVHCPNSPACDWTGALGTASHNLREHERKCRDQPTACEYCSASILLHDLVSHYNDVCPERTVECSACGQRTTFREFAQHSGGDGVCKGCETCPNGCKQVYPQRLREQHANRDCPKHTIICMLCLVPHSMLASEFDLAHAQQALAQPRDAASQADLLRRLIKLSPSSSIQT